MDLIIWPGTGAPRAMLGGKAAALDALSETDLPIPAWFALAPEACAASLAPERRAALERALAVGDADAAAAALADLTPDPAVSEALARAVAALCPDGAPVAVRSSAVEEDGTQTSFAGQLDSYLNVAPADVATRVVDVWRSAFGARALAYGAAAGGGASPQAPAVLVQRMVRAVCAGVAFSADPATGQRGVAVVAAVAGLGDRLVSGASDALTARVDRAGAITFAHVGAGHEVPLSERQVAAIAGLARACERHFGRPQDIEWAMEAGQLYLLQVRPITTLADVPDPDGWVRLWDNSNIAESYGGVTTPLTFSFALHVYEEVYRQLALTLGAPPRLVEEHADTFRHMLGMVRGRVYYNLISWYRLLSLLPGFSVNRRFMEQMMGVKEGLPPSVLAELTAIPWHARVNDARRLLVALVGLAAKLLTLPRRVRAFTRRLDGVLGAAPDLAAMRPDELVAHYRDLERRLITHWDAPLINDLFAMVFYGLLRALVARWCGDATGALANDLVSGEGGIISAEPAARVRELARLAAADPALVATLATGTTGEIERAVRAHPAFATRYAAYLERFADRCLEELKLESATLRDDPLPLLRAVAQVAQSAPTAGTAASAGAALRVRAERRARQAIGAHPLRRALFRVVLSQARRRIRDRENLRFERTRVFGRVRRVVVELGRRLYATDRLRDPRDVFYLEIGEVLGYVEGTATTTDLAGMVALRQAEYAGYRAAAPPDDRFETRGAVYQGNRFRAATASPSATPDRAEGERRQGIGCCPGVVRGRVRIITDPREARLGPGEILVAERTDPGWIMLFPAAAGVVVERGSLLSHSAIVARELGIPTIVAARGVLGWLAEGDLVQMDGAAGTITRLVGPDAAAAAPGRRPSMRAADRATLPPAQPLPAGSIAARADFSAIRYAQCWEDADILLEALDVRPGDTCVSIASAGDNTLALLTRAPGRVIALDLSAAQLACLELRVAAYRTLEHPELLELVGSRSSERRAGLYERCRVHLTPATRAFWDARPADIAAGIGGAGKFERYLALFRRRMLPLVHSAATRQALLAGGPPEERARFYREQWDTWRWRLVFRLFFSRFVMARAGRDPEFFRYVEGGVAERLLARAHHALTALDPAANPYLHWILTGQHGAALPLALRPEHFATIRANLDRLEWRQQSVEDFAATAAPGSVDRFNLSDIFEYVAPPAYEATLGRLLRVARPGARLAYWNLLASRSRPQALAGQLRPLAELAARLHQADRAFFYSALVVEEVTG